MERGCQQNDRTLGDGSRLGLGRGPRGALHLALRRRALPDSPGPTHSGILLPLLAPPARSFARPASDGHASLNEPTSQPTQPLKMRCGLSTTAARPAGRCRRSPTSSSSRSACASSARPTTTARPTSRPADLRARDAPLKVAWVDWWACLKMRAVLRRVRLLEGNLRRLCRRLH